MMFKRFVVGKVEDIAHLIHHLVYEFIIQATTLPFNRTLCPL